jgi:hypothetical protein
VVLDNSYGKLSSYVAAWTHDLDNSMRADDMRSAAEYATRLLGSVQR